MTSMIPWSTIKTVLLDLDGTLLDLNFDNYFWQQFVPQRYARHRGIPSEAATEELMEKYQSVEGTIDWYCVEYWSRELELDIAELKAEIKHLIRVHPTVIDFLHALKNKGKNVILVTNAHQHSLNLKLNHTNLHGHFNAIVCAHEYGMPKEDHLFWRHLEKDHPFHPEQTILIDDSLPVLRSAKQYGIKYLITVARPDSKKPTKQTDEFQSINDFSSINPMG